MDGDAALMRTTGGSDGGGAFIQSEKLSAIAYLNDFRSAGAPTDVRNRTGSGQISLKGVGSAGNQIGRGIGNGEISNKITGFGE